MAKIEMTEQDFADFVRAAIEESCGGRGDNDDLGGEELDIRTFEDAGLLTSDHGLVIRVGDAEFQLTIKRAC